MTFDLYEWANDPQWSGTPTWYKGVTDQSGGMPEPDKQIPCEVYSRIVGYVRPVRNWNTGKKQEWKDRRAYDVPRNLHSQTR